MTEKVRITPTGPRVVVLPDPTPQSLMKGGLHIPDAAVEKPITGTILVVGPGPWMAHRVLFHALGTRAVPAHLAADMGEDYAAVVPFREGQRVVFGKYVGTPFVIDDIETIILDEEEVLAILGDL